MTESTPIPSGTERIISEELAKAYEMLTKGDDEMVGPKISGWVEVGLRIVIDKAKRQFIGAADERLQAALAGVKGGKAISKFEMGESVGIIKQTNLFELWEQQFDRNLSGVKYYDLHRLKDLRNPQAHQTLERKKEDVRFLWEFLIKLLTECELVEKGKIPPREFDSAGFIRKNSQNRSDLLYALNGHFLGIRKLIPEEERRNHGWALDDANLLTIKMQVIEIICLESSEGSGMESLFLQILRSLDERHSSERDPLLKFVVLCLDRLKALDLPCGNFEESALQLCQSGGVSLAQVQGWPPDSDKFDPGEEDLPLPLLQARVASSDFPESPRQLEVRCRWGAIDQELGKVVSQDREVSRWLSELADEGLKKFDLPAEIFERYEVNVNRDEIEKGWDFVPKPKNWAGGKDSSIACLLRIEEEPECRMGRNEPLGAGDVATFDLCGCCFSIAKGHKAFASAQVRPSDLVDHKQGLVEALKHCAVGVWSHRSGPASDETFLDWLAGCCIDELIKDLHRKRCDRDADEFWDDTVLIAYSPDFPPMRESSKTSARKAMLRKSRNRLR